MRKRINKGIEKVSQLPLEKFGSPTLFLGCLISSISLGVIVYCLTMPLLVKNGHHLAYRSLGSLLWKARTNR